MRKERISLTVILATALSCLVYGQPGTNDSTFNQADGGNGYGDSPTGGTNAYAVVGSGKIIIGGDFTFVHGYARNRIARLNGDGTPDLSFDPGTGFDNTVYCVAAQADGKLIVGGDFTTCAGISRSRIVRLNSNGSVDLTFDPGSGFNFPVRALAIQPDGKVLVGGAFTTFNGAAQNKLVRLNSSGSRDTGFNPGTIPGSISVYVQSLAVKSNGQVLVGGNFNSVGVNPRPGLALFNTDGGLVASFPAVGVTNLYPNSILIRPDGKLLLGTFNSAEQLNADGTYDTGFTNYPFTGGPLTPEVYQVALQADGKALVHGDFKNYNGALLFRRGMARLNTDGSLDASFQPASAGRLLVLADGRLITASGSVRLNSDGSADATYYPGTGPNGTVHSVLPLPDGRIIVGGEFTRYEGHDVSPLIRLSPDGERDPTFTAALPMPVTSSYYGGIVQDVLHQPDGKLIVAREGVDRLNSDGSLDPTFDDGSGGNSNSGGRRRLALLPDGKVLVAGDFTEYNGQDIRGLLRLGPNGSIDSTFDASVVIGQGVVYDIAVQPDGRILFVDGARIVRLNANGTADPTFTGPTITGDPYFPYVDVLALQPDGSILIGGSLSVCNGIPRKGIARLLANGTLDETFNTSGPEFYQPWALAVQEDGRIVIGGGNEYYGSPRTSIARLNADGSPDPTFNTGTGIANYAYSYARIETLELLPDGDLLAGGIFTNYNGTGRNRLARINGNGTQEVDLSARVFLGGAYAQGSGLMSDALRAGGYLLVDEPYSVLGYSYVGPGAGSVSPVVLSTTGDNAIVDWVVVELRDPDDATVISASRPALLQRDGDVVDVDGFSPLTFAIAPGEYHVAVLHRNHLATMTAGTFALGPEPRSVDLTSPTTATYGTDARMAIGNVRALWSGDVNFDGTVKYTGSANDRDPILIAIGSFTPNNTINGYRHEDVNLNGQVRYTGALNDRDPILVNVGSTVPTNVRVAQLP